jgi:hypothetical protein
VREIDVPAVGSPTDEMRMFTWIAPENLARIAAVRFGDEYRIARYGLMICKLRSVR